jgi:hypothetical protein
MIGRRGVIQGGAAVAIAAATVQISDALADKYVWWECSQFSRDQYPDDWRQWPEDNQKLARRVVERWLARIPGAKIVEDISLCVGPDHPRYPDQSLQPEHFKGGFHLVRQVRLDRAIPEYDDPGY